MVRRIFYFAAALWVCCTVVFLPEGFAENIFIELDSSAPWHVTPRADYVFETGVKAQSGDFSVGRTGISLKKEYRHSSGMPVDLTISVDQYFLHDETAVDLPASLQSKGLMLGTKIPMPFVQGEHFFLAVNSGLYFQSAGHHAFHSGTVRSKNRISGIYKKEKLILAAGVMLQPDYEDSDVVPFAGFQYMMNDQWSFHFLSHEPYIAYRFNEQVTFRCTMGGYRDEFETAQGARKGDIVRISELHAGLGIDYVISDAVRLQADAGWAFARKYEYLKNGGKVVPDDGLFLGFALKMKF